MLHFDAGHALSLLERFTHRAVNRRNIDNIAALDPKAFAHASAERMERAIGGLASDENGDLGRTDINGCE
jgi:hypothetical protein